MSTRGSLFISKAITQIYAQFKIWFCCSKGSKGKTKRKRSLADTAGGTNLFCRIKLVEKELAKLQKGNTLAENKDSNYICRKGKSRLRLLE